MTKMSESFFTDWTPEKINLLCCGFVRSNTLIVREHFPCKDVSSIVAYYVTDCILQVIHNHRFSKVYYDLISSNITIDFKQILAVKGYPHGCSMVIFKPFVSQLLNRIAIKQEK